MRRLADAAGAEWEWRQPRWWARHWELRRGADCAAALTGTGLWRPRMVAVTADARWRLRLRGWVRGRLEVSPEDGGPPLAVFTSGAFGGGVLESATASYHWRREGAWGRRWRFEDAHGHPQLTLGARGFLRTGTLVLTATEAGRACADLPLLAVTGCCVLAVLGRRATALG